MTAWNSDADYFGDVGGVKEYPAEREGDDQGGAHDRHPPPVLCRLRLPPLHPLRAALLKFERRADLRLVQLRNDEAVRNHHHLCM